MADGPTHKRNRWGDTGGDAGTAEKRQKVDANGAGAATNGASAAPRPNLSLDALEKAKKALQLQKQLAEKLKKLPTLAPAGGVPAMPAAAAAAGPPAMPTVPGVRPSATLLATGAQPAQTLSSVAKAVKPAPLRLDEFGREVDEKGNVIERPKAPVTSLKVNLRAAEARAAAAAAGEAAPAEEEADVGPAHDDFFDPSLGSKGLKRLERRPRNFMFVEPGRLQKAAQIARLRAQYGDDAVQQLRARQEAEKAAERAAAEVDVNKIPLGERAPAKPEKPEKPPVPDVEWWDARLLAHKSYEADVEGREVPELRPGAVTALVEHPVLEDPPAEAPPPEPQPLKLTKKEQKKLRTQRRTAREKEKQELMRQGLLEAPKPKVKISNLMRVLGAEATADPTAIEVEVRKQMAERQQAHDDRNAARKLLPSERKEKKLGKMFDEGQPVTHVSLYKVGHFDAPQNRFKVDVNALENHMTGLAVVSDGFVVVVVEGCPKSQRRYQKLMMRRINWDLQRDDADEGAPQRPNYCHLVWQGVVLEPAFEKFKVETAASEAAAKQLLADRGVPHYWDLAAAYAPP